MEIIGRTRRPSEWRWPLLVSVVVLNITISGFVLSYGILLIHAIANELPLWLAFLTPTVFIFCYSVSQCWCREAAESWGSNGGNRVLAAAGLGVIVISLVVCAAVPVNLQAFIYGICGGFGTSLIISQVEAVTFEMYDSRLDIVKGLSVIGQAIGQSAFPIIINAIVQEYGYSRSYIMFAAIFLQMLPFIMFLTVDESTKRISYSRYSDLAQACAVIDSNAFDVQINDLYLKKRSNSTEDFYYDDDEVEDIDDNFSFVGLETVTPPSSPEERRRNIFGVEIMPEIPEETEDSESEAEQSNKTKNKQVDIAIKRLSSLSESFDDYISRRNSDEFSSEESSMKDYSQIDVKIFETNASDQVFVSQNYFQRQTKFARIRRRLGMSSYKYYRLNKRIKYFYHSVIDTFIKPLARSLGCWRFYPVLILAFCRFSSITITLVLLPLICFDLNPDLSISEIIFLLTMHGFSGMAFLLCTLWLQTKKRNNRYIVAIGLSVYAGATYLLSEVQKHRDLVIGCVTAGIGFGALTSSWEAAARDFLGPRKWHKLRSPMETLAGLGLTALVSVLTLTMKGAINTRLTMVIMCGVYGVAAIVWLVIALVSFYLDQIKTLKLRRR